MRDASRYRFRVFTAADLGMAQRWLASAEVVRWWGDPAGQLALLRNDLQEPRMQQWIIEYRRRPFAYLQAYEAHAWPQAHLRHLPAGAQVIDTFIGEPKMMGRGHGRAFLRLMCRHLLEEGAPVVATDPAVTNVRARRAYAAAGFKEEAEHQAEQGPVVVMVYRSPD